MQNPTVLTLITHRKCFGRRMWYWIFKIKHVVFQYIERMLCWRHQVKICWFQLKKCKTSFVWNLF